MANRLLNFFNSPTTALAAGLLSPTPTGSFGGGLQQGIASMLASQRAAMRNELLKAQLMQWQQQQDEAKRQRLAYENIVGTAPTVGQGPVQPGQPQLMVGGSGAQAATSPGGQQITREELRQGMAQQLPNLGPQGVSGLSSLLGMFEKTPEQIESEAYAKETGTRRASLETVTPEELAAMAQAHANQARQNAQQGFNQAKDLRNAFTRGSGEFIKVRDNYVRIKAAASDPSAAGDMALIYSFMKMLDPGSTVMQGEQATAENARGVGEDIRATYNRAITGETMAPSQRKDFVKRADKLYAAQLGGHRDLKKEYTRLSNEFEVNPSGVIVDLEPNEYMLMTQGELANINVDSLSPADLQRYMEAINGNR